MCLRWTKLLALLVLVSISITFLASAQESEEGNDLDDLIVLPEQLVAELRIESAEVVEARFEDRILAVGVVETIPARHRNVSTPADGRIVELNAIEGDSVETNEVVVVVETREPVEPPPTLELTAPISGLVTESHAKLGEPVRQGREIVEISDLSEVHTLARVRAKFAQQLLAGMKARIRVAAIPGVEFDGQLVSFVPASDDSGDVDAIFTMPNDSERLRPGMRAEVSIITGERSDVLVMPREALVGEPDARMVLVRDFELPQTFLKLDEIVVGETNDRFVEIVSGLFPGDEVVINGADSLLLLGEPLALKAYFDRLDADGAHRHYHGEPKLASGSNESLSSFQIFLLIAGVLMLGLALLSLFARSHVFRGSGS